MIVTDQSIRRGTARIPFLFGLSYREPSLRAEVWLPVPLNFVVRWFVEWRERYNIWRGVPSKWMIAHGLEVRDACMEGEAAGIVTGWKRSMRHSSEALSLLASGHLTGHDFRERARDYGYEPPDEIKRLIPLWMEEEE